MVRTAVPKCSLKKSGRRLGADDANKVVVDKQDRCFDSSVRQQMTTVTKKCEEQACVQVKYLQQLISETPHKHKLGDCRKVTQNVADCSGMPTHRSSCKLASWTEQTRLIERRAKKKALKNLSNLHFSNQNLLRHTR